MEKTSQKLIIIAVIGIFLIFAVELLNGLIHERSVYAGSALANTANPFAEAILNERLSVHRLTERSSKYAVLFLIITFGGCFLFETLRGLRIHPVQYTLVGAAVSMFFLLLLSLGEQIGFALAYLAAAAACIALITGYLSAVLGGWTRAGMLAAMLALAYTVLYFLLHTSEYTLLIGSLLLFAALAAVMYGTRHFDWYDLKAKASAENDHEPFA